MVKTVFKDDGLLAVGGLVSLGLGLGGFEKSASLFDLAFGGVLLQKSEQGVGDISVNGFVELVNTGGDLKSVKEDSLLSLE